jgi:cell wall-associated NlpC family hydrolase
MSSSTNIINATRSQLGVPFVLGKRYDGVALDCVGLLEVVAARCGIPLKAPPGYSIRTLLKINAHELALQAGMTEKHGKAEPGDIVRLELRKGRAIHFGIVVGHSMIHACDRRKLVVEDWFLNCADACVRGVYLWPN